MKQIQEGAEGIFRVGIPDGAMKSQFQSRDLCDSGQIPVVSEDMEPAP